jgi:hypothetical protein
MSDVHVTPSGDGWTIQDDGDERGTFATSFGECVCRTSRI